MNLNRNFSGYLSFLGTHLPCSTPILWQGWAWAHAHPPSPGCLSFGDAQFDIALKRPTFGFASGQTYRLSILCFRILCPCFFSSWQMPISQFNRRWSIWDSRFDFEMRLLGSGLQTIAIKFHYNWFEASSSVTFIIQCMSLQTQLKCSLLTVICL